MSRTTPEARPAAAGTRPRFLGMARDGAVVLLIVAASLIALEGLTRLFWPQEIERANVDDGSLGLDDDVLGLRLRPFARVLVDGPEFSATYDINGQGLRDAVTRSGPKPPGVMRILVLGDSFTFGIGNAYDEVWPVVFERLLHEQGHPVDVVKAGVPGYDTRTEALYLERIFADYEPDVVLVAFVTNDLITNRPLGQSSVEGTSVDDAAPIPYRAEIDKGSTLHSLILLKRLLMSNDFLYTRLYLLTPRREWFARAYGERMKRQIELTQELFLRIQAYCAKNGAELVVLSLPQQFQVLAASRGEEAVDVDVDGIDDVFSAFAERHGFTWMAALPHLVESYEESGEDLYFRYDGHMSAAGNAALARFLVDRLAPRLIERANDGSRAGEAG